MNLKAMLGEYGLEIDDVRWYLAAELTERLLALKSDPAEITRYIWSGKMEGELYNMAERFIEDLQDRLDRGLSEEGRIREIMTAMVKAKKKRFR